MFRRILNLMRQDLTNTLRDNILLYMIFGPILLAVGARLFLPALDQAALTVAVEQRVDPAVVARLETISQVELLPDAAAVEARVLRSDDVPGIIIESNSPVMLLEGNEGKGVDEWSALAGQAISGSQVGQYTTTGGARSLLTEYTAIIFLLIGTLIGALLMAFNIIEDKETRAIRAMGVSPLSMFELTFARGLFAIGASLTIVLAATAILMGARVHYGLLLVGFFFSLGLPILSGYIIGGIADTQLKAIAILKFFMLVYLTLPIITIFVPSHWLPAFYILPNYWMWHTFENLFIGPVAGPGFWLSGIITLLSSLALIVLALPVLRRQLKLR